MATRQHTLTFVETGRSIVSPCCTAGIVELREVMSDRDYAKGQLYTRLLVAGHGWTSDLKPGAIESRFVKCGPDAERWSYCDGEGNERPVWI